MNAEDSRMKSTLQHKNTIKNKSLYLNNMDLTEITTSNFSNIYFNLGDAMHIK